MPIARKPIIFNVFIIIVLIREDFCYILNWSILLQTISYSEVKYLCKFT